MKKKILVFSSLIVFIVFLICVLTYLTKRSNWYLENQIMKNRILLSESFERESAVYNQVKDAFEQEQLTYHLLKEDNALPEHIQESIDLLQEDCLVDIEDIIYYGSEHASYFKNACVFHTVVRVGSDVYAWVDLVYNENMRECIGEENYLRGLEAEAYTQLSDHWYVVRLYGY